MAEDVITTSSDSNGGRATALAERPADEAAKRDMRALAAEALAPAPTPAKGKGKKNKKKQDDDDDLEYEVEFATPFGKIEFEFEPLTKKQKKDEQKKVRAEREAAKAAEKAAKLAEKRALKGDSGGGGRGTGLLIGLIIVAIVAAAIVIAVWLFARPGEDEDAIPAQFRADDAPEAEPVAPQGFVARMKNRAQSAVRAGKQASRDAQAEQQRKFEQMSGR